MDIRSYDHLIDAVCDYLFVCTVVAFQSFKNRDESFLCHHLTFYHYWKHWPRSSRSFRVLGR